MLMFDLLLHVLINLLSILQCVVLLLLLRTDNNSNNMIFPCARADNGNAGPIMVVAGPLKTYIALQNHVIVTLTGTQ